MKKFVSFLFSMLFTGILVIIFAIAIGYATFIENDYGTLTAKILVYNSRWFEILLAIICINLIGSVFENKLFSRKRWPGFLFHIAFVFIIIGAGVTRYFGYEGTMHIREGESASFIVSEETYVKITADNGQSNAEKEVEVKFSPYTANHFSEEIELNGKAIRVKNLQYVPSAAETVVPDPNGEPIVSLMAVGQGMQRTDFNLKSGDNKTAFGKIIGFNMPDNATDINLKIEQGNLYFVASDSVFIMGMNGEKAASIPPETEHQMNTQTVYSSGNMHFAVKQFFQHATTRLAYSPPQQGGSTSDAIQTEITVGNQSKTLAVYGTKGVVGKSYTTTINGTEVTVSFGSKKIELPFSIYLTDFQLERYPGSNSPSSYASEVVLKDGATKKPFRIFMNNILKYQGYRFFQSSYDTDEKGTILSVNSDAWGTSITYFGYLIMAIGMILTLFNKNSRFMKLIRASARLSNERKKLFAVIIFGVLFSSVNADAQNIIPLNKKHVSEFEELLLQSTKGRTEPTATLASEILRKVAKKNKWERMSASEVFLSMQSNPEQWKSVAIIKVANPELKKMLDVTGDYTSFNNIVLPREKGGYRLNAAVSKAFSKKSSERDKLDKEIINVDERVNILFNVFSGNFFTVFPVPNHENQKWVTANDAEALEENAVFAAQATRNYLGAVAAYDWGTASQILDQIKDYQQKEGARIIPSSSKIKLEILYHKWDVFGKLSKILLTAGLVLLLLQLYTIFNPRTKMATLKKVGFIFILLLFAVETAGLAVRWYISGHAPWSNGYESMVFVSWATLLSGIIFVRRSEITLSLTTLLAGLTLLVAGFSWMSPEITNLVPVLKSYWLIVHVAIIMASYGFLGIGAMLGLLNLLLIIFRNKKNKKRVNHTIKELVVIIHISLILGIFMLTAGSFIGGIWANESWGRYWGWDPKETWAMVTILAYTFIVHMHKIPGFKGSYAVSAASLVGFGSVLMTYFGVNYYLSGLHSYAQGEPAPIPAGVYVAIVAVIMLVIIAFVSDKKEKQEEIVI
ncbi:cytochrome c-type biogenesis protein CcsB [Mariniphaga anaerophila]|uniref:Cytochrome c-type biogenesis protein CcsB n=1 Tax=Mariniphaga anaerophila TaxID=1484053 RepID=A0A1M5CVE4_9BACT|nr:cytochrome c biogenesis protein CcsA [Mariniphaga anaerophila]SHF58715.1 cytochrome c-type biogenesis protein CcsB [Mariniphaga anaerophila]